VTSINTVDIAKEVRVIMAQHDISQADIMQALQKKGLKYTQSAVSRAIQGQRKKLLKEIFEMLGGLLKSKTPGRVAEQAGQYLDTKKLLQDLQSLRQENNTLKTENSKLKSALAPALVQTLLQEHHPKNNPLTYKRKRG